MDYITGKQSLEAKQSCAYCEISQTFQHFHVQFGKEMARYSAL